MGKSKEKKLDEVQAKLDQDPKLRELVAISQTLTGAFNQLLDIVYSQGQAIEELKNERD